MELDLVMWFRSSICIFDCLHELVMHITIANTGFPRSILASSDLPLSMGLPIEDHTIHPPVLAQEIFTDAAGLDPRSENVAGAIRFTTKWKPILIKQDPEYRQILYFLPRASGSIGSAAVVRIDNSALVGALKRG